MVQQYLAAVLNKAAFDSNDGGAIAAAKAACTGSSSDSKNAILAAANALDAFNNGGDSEPFPPGTPSSASSSADPQGAQAVANKSSWDSFP